MNTNLSNGLLNQFSKNHLVFLGTGSMKPSKYRSVSNIYFNNIIFDIGEGSTHQLELVFGKEYFNMITNNIDIVYISHFHADH